MQVINTNIAALNSQRNLDRSSDGLQVALQRLSSGLRINSAKDDAAGLAISERMTGQIRGMDQARRNANDGVSLAQTSEGAMDQMSAILQRIRELAVQSANASNTASDRQALNNEASQLTAELQRFALSAQFNGQNLFDGSFGTATYQVGANANQTITTTTANFQTSQYGTNQVGAQTYSTAAISGTSLAASASGAVFTGTLATSNLLVNGAGGSATISLASGSSAKDIAAAVNSQAFTGVKASAQTNAVVTFGSASSYALNLTGTNSTQVQVSFTLSATNTAAGLSAAVTAFNDVSSKTGITAKLNATNDGVELTAADGSNVFMQAASTGASVSVSGAAGAVMSGTSTTLQVGGQLTFDSDKSYNVNLSGGAFNAGAVAAAAVGSGTTTVGSLQAVSTLDISTFANATKALRIADSALQAIVSQRAVYGALQSRFENTIANLQSSSENLSAARSRIRDADFAAETSNLTRAQILQQAGTAMLAQANAIPQQVLQLLQG